MSNAAKNILKLQDIVSVVDFGAVGDGVADDTAAIQAALTASVSRVLCFPTGVYRLTSNLVGDGSQIVEYEAGVTFPVGSISGVVSFAYALGQSYSMRIRRSVSSPTTVSPTVLNITSGKGDNATVIGVSGGYFQARDENDVNASNKGVLYGLQLSLVPRVVRNNIPYDDVAGLVVQNDADVAGARGTDAIYIGRNGAGAFGNDEAQWVTGVTVAPSVGYAFRSTGGNFCGINISGRMVGSSNIGFSFLGDSTIQSSVTDTAAIYRSEPSTQAASFTLTNLRHFSATLTTLGAGSSITYQTGYYASPSISGAANNYGFFSQLTAGAGNWNFYAQSDAANYFGGQVLINTAATAVSTSGSVSAQLQVAGTSGARSAVTFARFSNDVNSPSLNFIKSRGTSIGSGGALSSGDLISTIGFDGNDGSTQVRAANIIAGVDGAPGTGAMPGRISISTTPSGSGTPVERLRVDSSGNIIETQPAPTAINTTTTLTVANLRTKIITSTTAATVTATLPTGADMDSLYAAGTDMGFNWSVINTGSNAFTVQQGVSAHTVLGNMTVAASSSGAFRSRRSGASTWVTYRVI